MGENNLPKNRRNKWWKRNRWNVLFTILGAIASGYIGYLIGFHVEVSTTVNDNIDTIKTEITNISACIKDYHEEVQSATKNISYNTRNGIKCDVGVNNNIKNYFVTVSALHNPHNLKQDDKLYFICENKNDRSLYCVEAYVDIVEVSPDSKAEFFLNNRMFEILGIKYPRGIYSLFFKRIPKD